MSDESWSYAPVSTVFGALQRGLGRGAVLARGDDDVLACVLQDYRWDSVDERAVYLARLVRDRRIPVAPIVAALSAASSRVFTNVLDVLEVLGRAEVAGVADGIRQYIATGERWLEVLDRVASSWPAPWWDDLFPVVQARLDPATRDRITECRGSWWGAPQWQAWAGYDPGVAAAVGSRPVPREAPRPYAERSVPDLLDLLRKQHEPDRVLRELRRRPPEPALLELVDGLLPVVSGWPLTSAIRHLGAAALPAARGWAHRASHPLHQTGLDVVVEHGTEPDVPLLRSELRRLDEHRDELCGYNRLFDGLARIGGADARAELPRLRRLWTSPHSYERAAYLRARLALDPDDVQKWVMEGLFDAEARVRQLAVLQVELTTTTRERLAYLRDDPIEDPDVRAIATKRLE
ncbi:hypothetical protein ACWKSP_28160 [Micromonosporaceae bacterium Da 78-11]